ncbi:hypothetical protein [Coleofasciculus chthonoplastes]
MIKVRTFFNGSGDYWRIGALEHLAIYADTISLESRNEYTADYRQEVE